MLSANSHICNHHVCLGYSYYLPYWLQLTKSLFLKNPKYSSVFAPYVFVFGQDLFIWIRIIQVHLFAFDQMRENIHLFFASPSCRRKAIGTKLENSFLNQKYKNFRNQTLMFLVSAMYALGYIKRESFQITLSNWQKFVFAHPLLAKWIWNMQTMCLNLMIIWSLDMNPKPPKSRL